MKIPYLKRPPRVAVVRLQGAIGISGRGGPGLSDAGLAPMLERAFKRKKPVAVALIVNSPGGSPVQSSLIGARIRRLAEEHDVPVHAFVEDVAASGGYWLASAADFIWADESSVLGSIGVISAGFGFTELIHKVGVERRVHTAGRSKSMLDPFRPETPEDVARLERLLGPIHTAFKQQILKRRGNRLPPDRDLFTGEIWTGLEAVELGLADGIAHMVPKMRELYGEDLRFMPYSQRVPLFRRFGLSADEVIGSLEERAAFSRFGANGP
ncbi:S49 family peptidase [Paracoccus sulfuroxidans]|uniref:Serine protease SohB n=1 Tax=Paracoccus sulfuroxidans TaxID=384678 RepID=A0A562NQF8_9RHOB|nr:S49 family peptidase [Paracoccus sulfuroxidans]TWI34363.1 serine protease SohB [Paracoccus sulfuroxidans]